MGGLGGDLADQQQHIRNEHVNIINVFNERNQVWFGI